MAKRRKVKEEIDFKFPEFDEKDFIRKERRGTKIAIITFLYGIAIGVISQFLWSGMSSGVRWPLIFLFALFMIPFLYTIISKLTDISDLRRKNWISTYITYFMVWITILIILVNPPFYDSTPPSIDLHILPEYQEPGGSVVISAYITDNSGVDKINISIETPNRIILYPRYSQNDSLYILRYKNEEKAIGRFNVTVAVKDTNGNRKRIEKSFWYSQDAISLAYPKNGSEVNHATPIRFDVKNLSDEKFEVYYLIDGKRINMTKTENLYETSPIYRGWEKNKNVSIKVMAKVVHYFYGRCVNNTVVDNSTYLFHTDPNDDLIGTENPPSIKNLPSPTKKNITPGFEIPILLFAVLLVIVWKKRR